MSHRHARLTGYLAPRPVHFDVVNVKGDVIFLDGQSGHVRPGRYRNYGFRRTDQ